MRNYSSKIDLTNTLDELDFLIRHRTSYDWSLIETNFELEQHDYDIYWADKTTNKYVDFEHVLNNIPLDIQEKLLFNLDLFR